MAKAETASTRAPRGTKPVSQAFFTALDAVPEAQRAAVAKAAQVVIRDELKLRREKVKAATAKVKAGAPARKTSAPRKTPAPRKVAAPVVKVAEEKPAPKPVRKPRRSPEPKIAA
jgi:TRAP-type C4-dicarboxylate transport system substrate-binding protein